MEFSLKTKLVTGYGCLKKIGEIVQSFGVKKVLRRKILTMLSGCRIMRFVREGVVGGL